MTDSPSSRPDHGPDHHPRPESTQPSDYDPGPAIRRQALSISVAVAPFGLAFGITAATAELSLLETIGFSTLVFSGGAQFASVSVLAAGGSAGAAVTAAMLLNLRLLAFGVVVAPALKGPWWGRALAGQLVIDETTAVASAQTDLRWQRYGFLTTGLMLFAFWNVSTVLGVTVLGGADDLITDLGIDATIPAAFLALLWPRLGERRLLLVTVIGAAIAVVTAPVLAPGLPILAAAVAVVAARPWRSVS